MAPPQRANHVRWLESFAKVSRWMERHGSLEERLDAGGGLCKLEAVFPDEVAAGLLSELQAIPEAQWNATEASADYAHNNIS
jgi:hypothetical protein